ncbi:MAG: ankyrin repeat domain-containing protein, partial [Candidatus Omnitrophica bacterium]|nr:ankyrin repeat domain-containing protein [Candidatus Omnitrophota bacterium]
LLAALILPLFHVPSSLAQGRAGEDYYIDTILLQDDYWPDNGKPALPYGRGHSRPYFWDERTKGVPAENAYVAAILKGSLSEVQNLYAQRHDNETIASNGGRLLRSAAALGKIDIVDYFLQQGIAVDAGSTPTPENSSEHNVTALMYAARMGDTDMVVHLLENGADVRHKSTLGSDALLFAAAGNHFATVIQLLNHGADINAGNTLHIDTTALHIAIRNGHANIVELFIRHGADLELRDNYGYTPLHKASSTGNLHLAKMLILYGADVKAATQDGKQPIDVINDHWLDWPESYKKDLQELLTHYMNNPVSSAVHAFAAAKIQEAGAKIPNSFDRVRRMRAQQPAARASNNRTRQNAQEDPQNNTRPSRTYSREIIRYKKKDR